MQKGYKNIAFWENATALIRLQWEIKKNSMMWEILKEMEKNMYITSKSINEILTAARGIQKTANDELG